MTSAPLFCGGLGTDEDVVALDHKVPDLGRALLELPFEFRRAGIRCVKLLQPLLEIHVRETIALCAFWRASFSSCMRSGSSRALSNTL